MRTAGSRRGDAETRKTWKSGCVTRAPYLVLAHRLDATDEDGTDVVLSPFIQWQNGKTELVWPTEHATADFVYPALPFEER